MSDLEVRLPMWDGLLNSPADSAFIARNGELIDPPLSVEMLINMTHDLASRVTDALRALDEVGALEKMGKEQMGSLHKGLFITSAMLVALGRGEEGVTVEGMLMEMLSTINNDDDDEESEI